MMGLAAVGLLAIVATASGSANRGVPSQADVEKYYNASPPVDPAMLELVVTGQLKCKYSDVQLGNLTGLGYSSVFLTEYEVGQYDKPRIKEIIAQARFTSPDGYFRLVAVKSCASVQCRLGKENITTANLGVWADPHKCTDGRKRARLTSIEFLNPVESRFPYEWPADWEWTDQRVPRYRPNTVLELQAGVVDISDKLDFDWGDWGEMLTPPEHSNCTIEGICDPNDKEDSVSVNIQGMVYCNRHDRRAFHRAVHLYSVDPKKRNSAHFLTSNWSYASGNATLGAPGTLHRADYHLCWRGCPRKQGLMTSDGKMHLVMAVYHRCNEAYYKSIKLVPNEPIKLVVKKNGNTDTFGNINITSSNLIIDITDSNDNADYFNRSYNHDDYWGAVGEAARVEL